MCLSPILRPNTNYKNVRALAFGKDVENSKIYVPCGHCPECVAAKQNGLVQRVDAESRYNHLFFCTLTYDNAHLPVLSVEVPRCPSDNIGTDSTPLLFSVDDAEAALDSYGFDLQESELVHTCGEQLEYDGPDWQEVKLPFADIRHIQLLMKCLRNNNPVDGRVIRYLAVSELGKTYGRPHFHILFLVEKLDTDFDVNGRVISSVRYDLERRLWKFVFAHWAENVGTDKFPKYVPRFTYRKRFLGSRCYTNFDLHYVDPTLTTEGTSNVAYYVTKYMMKASEIEEKRKSFLKLNLSASEFYSVWNVIKCRMLVSKGLGVDGRFVTEEVEDREPMPMYVYAALPDDLPEDDSVLSWTPKVTIRRRRILVPRSEILERIHSDCCRDAGVAPGPIYIDYNGNHRPLAHYYQRFPDAFSVFDFLTCYLNYDDSQIIKSYELPKEEIQKKYDDHSNRLKIIDSHSDFDTNAALLWPTDSYDNNCIPCYGN